MAKSRPIALSSHRSFLELNKLLDAVKAREAARATPPPAETKADAPPLPTDDPPEAA